MTKPREVFGPTNPAQMDPEERHAGVLEIPLGTARFGGIASRR